MGWNTKGESILMKKLISIISKMIAKIHMPFNHKKMTEVDCMGIISIMKDGDVLLTHTAGELSNVVLAFLGHGSIVNNGKVWESVTAGTKDTDPMFFLSRKDAVCLYRPKFKVDIAAMNYFLCENKGRKYDFEFEGDDGQFYCFEYVACALNSASRVKVYPVKTPIGSQYLAKSFINENFDLIWKKK